MLNQILESIESLENELNSKEEKRNKDIKEIKKINTEANEKKIIQKNKSKINLDKRDYQNPKIL